MEKEQDQNPQDNPNTSEKSMETIKLRVQLKKKIANLKMTKIQ